MGSSGTTRWDTGSPSRNRNASSSDEDLRDDASVLGVSYSPQPVGRNDLPYASSIIEIDLKFADGRGQRIQCLPDSGRKQSMIGLLDYARWYLRLERRRATSIAVGRGKARWLMLLDLWIATSEGRTISVSSLCIAGGVPDTTGLRKIAELKRAGLIVGENDPRDGRRSLMKLTDVANVLIETQLQSELWQLQAFAFR